MRTFIGAVKSRIAKGKIPVKKVKITSAEGITTVVNKLKKRNFRTLESASEALKVLVPTDGGYYNKVNFKVFFVMGNHCLKIVIISNSTVCAMKLTIMLNAIMTTVIVVQLNGASETQQQV